MSDRLPPHSPEAEQGMLACLLLSAKDILPKYVERSTPEAFYDLRHQVIYSAAVELWTENKPVDEMTVTHRLKDKQMLEQVGGIEYMTRLPDMTPSAANWEYFLDIVLEKFTLRRIIQVCTDTASKAFEAMDNASDQLDSAEKNILSIRGKSSQDSKTAKALVDASINRIEQVFLRGGAIGGLSTGLSDLDRMTDGLHVGEMTVLAAYPGNGKTSLAMNIVEHISCDLHLPVGVFSLEMTDESLVTRLLCSRARVNLRRIGHGFMEQGDFPKLTHAAAAVSKASLWVEDSSDISVYQLRAKARRLHQEHGIKLLVVDYLQLLNAAGGSRKVESRQQEVSDISAAMKGMSKELGIPVLALSQLNDDGKLRESRSIGQDADNVWVLEPKKSKDDDKSKAAQDPLPMVLNIKKQRNGPVGLLDLMFLKSFTRFECCAKVSDDDIPYTKPSHNDP